MVNYTVWDIYCVFRKVQANFNDRGYKLPKDWEKQWNEKFSETTREKLQTITNYFNTKWENISPERYFEAGFELFGRGFSYHKFLDKKIVEQYKRKDKLKKREIEVEKQSLKNDLKFVIREVRDNEEVKEMGILRYYCRSRESEEDYISKPIRDYLDNKISTSFLTWLISEKYLVLKNIERDLIPYVEENYRTIVKNLNEIKVFLIKLKELCHEKI